MVVHLAMVGQVAVGRFVTGTCPVSLMARRGRFNDCRGSQSHGLREPPFRKARRTDTITIQLDMGYVSLSRAGHNRRVETRNFPTWVMDRETFL
jgi:hypothetical protein